MIKDANGREWVLVPREATKEMALAMVNAPISGHPETGSPTVTDMWSEAIAAAPQFVPPEVTDEVAWKIVRAYADLPNRAKALLYGRDMIAVVQQVLGPLLGMVPAKAVERAFVEGYGARESEAGAEYRPLEAWQASAARRRIEGGGNG